MVGGGGGGSEWGGGMERTSSIDASLDRIQ